MYPASIDGIFANEEKFLIFGVKGAADDGVIV